MIRQVAMAWKSLAGHGMKELFDDISQPMCLPRKEEK